MSYLLASKKAVFLSISKKFSDKSSVLVFDEVWRSMKYKNHETRKQNYFVLAALALLYISFLNASEARARLSLPRMRRSHEGERPIFLPSRAQFCIFSYCEVLSFAKSIFLVYTNAVLLVLTCFVMCCVCCFFAVLCTVLRLMSCLRFDVLRCRFAINMSCRAPCFFSVVGLCCFQSGEFSFDRLLL